MIWVYDDKSKDQRQTALEWGKLRTTPNNHERFGPVRDDIIHQVKSWYNIRLSQ